MAKENIVQPNYQDEREDRRGGQQAYFWSVWAEERANRLA
jgi:hypothetical protein